MQSSGNLGYKEDEWFLFVRLVLLMSRSHDDHRGNDITHICPSAKAARMQLLRRL